MKYTQRETEHEVVLAPNAAPVGTVIVLHGLGADGWDFVPVVNELRLPDALPLRFLFPHAPVRPVTVNNGYEMRAWYDIRDFSMAGREDLDGISAASVRLQRYVELERAHGIASDSVVLAGFSQGGAVALHAGLRSTATLAGIVALSTYLPFRTRLAAEVSPTNRGLPILMCHGTEDPVVSVELGQASRDALQQHGYEVEWHAYPMGHAVCGPEIERMSLWLRTRYAARTAR